MLPIICYAYQSPHKDRWYGKLLRAKDRHSARFGRTFRRTFNICQIACHYTGDWVCNTHGVDDDGHNPKAVAKAFREAEKDWNGLY